MENEQLLNDIAKLINTIKWGSIEIQIHNSEVTSIKKTEHIKIKNPQYLPPSNQKENSQQI